MSHFVNYRQPEIDRENRHKLLTDKIYNLILEMFKIDDERPEIVDGLVASYKSGRNRENQLLIKKLAGWYDNIHSSKNKSFFKIATQPPAKIPWYLLWKNQTTLEPKLEYVQYKYNFETRVSGTWSRYVFDATENSVMSDRNKNLEFLWELSQDRRLKYRFQNMWRPGPTGIVGESCLKKVKNFIIDGIKDKGPFGSLSGDNYKLFYALWKSKKETEELLEIFDQYHKASDALTRINIGILKDWFKKAIYKIPYESYSYFDFAAYQQYEVNCVIDEVFQNLPNLVIDAIIGD